MGDTPCATCHNRYPPKSGCPACGGTGQARFGMPDSQPAETLEAIMPVDYKAAERKVRKAYGSELPPFKKEIL